MIGAGPIGFTLNPDNSFQVHRRVWSDPDSGPAATERLVCEIDLCSKGRIWRTRRSTSASAVRSMTSRWSFRPPAPVSTGRVTDDRAAPVADYGVHVFSTFRDRWFTGSRWVKTARPTQDGSFRVDGLPPGDYWVAAVERIEGTARRRRLPPAERARVAVVPRHADHARRRAIAGPHASLDPSLTCPPPPRSAATGPGHRRSPLPSWRRRAFALARVAVDGDDIYWIEGRPAEGGRNVLVRRRADGSIADVIPAGFNVRSRVHEYGGGAYVVAAASSTSRISPISVSIDASIVKVRARPVAITPEGQWFYADYAIDPLRPRLDLRARGSLRRRRGGQRRSSPFRLTASLGRRRDRQSGTTSIRPRDSAPTARGSLARVATSEHAVGRDRTVGRRR